MRSLVDDVGASAPRFRAEVYLGLYEHLAMRWAALVRDESTARAIAERQLAAPGSGRGLHEAARRHAAAALLAMLDEQPDAAAAHWQALLDAPEAGDVYGLAAEAHLRRADAQLRAGQPPAVAAAGLEALWGAQLDGDEGVLLLAGPEVLDRLARAPWGTTLPADGARMLAHAAAQAHALRRRATAAGDRSSPPAASMPLSEREQQVLARIAAGDSNKVIARALDLSPHTVKRHVANILDKLALDSRGRAAAWWQARAPR
jgi:LuxR family maltose regulon positive regulatory protein